MKFRILTRLWFHTLVQYVPWNTTDYINVRFISLQWQRLLYLELLSCFRILSSNVNWNRQRGYLPCSQSTDANWALTQVPAQLLSKAFLWTDKPPLDCTVSLTESSMRHGHTITAFYTKQPKPTILAHKYKMMSVEVISKLLSSIFISTKFYNKIHFYYSYYYYYYGINLQYTMSILTVHWTFFPKPRQEGPILVSAVCIVLHLLLFVVFKRSIYTFFLLFIYLFLCCFFGKRRYLSP